MAHIEIKSSKIIIIMVVGRNRRWLKGSLKRLYRNARKLHAIECQNWNCTSFLQQTTATTANEKQINVCDLKTNHLHPWMTYLSIRIDIHCCSRQYFCESILAWFDRKACFLTPNKKKKYSNSIFGCGWWYRGERRHSTRWRLRFTLCPPRPPLLPPLSLLLPYNLHKKVKFKSCLFSGAIDPRRKLFGWLLTTVFSWLLGLVPRIDSFLMKLKFCHCNNKRRSRGEDEKLVCSRLSSTGFVVVVFVA